MRFLSLIIVFLIHQTSFSQKVKVIDAETQKPIADVTIYNEDKSKVTYTNKKGEANIKEFKENDILTFHHLSFIEYEILKKDLPLLQNLLLLSKKAEQLEEIVLSASKTKEKRTRIAKKIEIKTKQEIKEILPQNTANLLSNIAGVRVQKTHFGGGSPVLRGMEANRVLLVVDGVRMNNAIYRKGHLHNSITISPTILDRTEVIFGPSSVIYGSDALGGVIHYYTKNLKTAKKLEIDTEIYGKTETVNKALTTQVSTQISNKKWASFTSISHSKFGDLKMGKNRNHSYKNWGKITEYSNNTDSFYNLKAIPNPNTNVQKNTAYHQTDFLQKLLFPITKNTELVVNGQYSTSSNINRLDKLTEYTKKNKLKYARWYYGPQKRLLISTQLKLSPKKKYLQKGSITAGYQKIEESRIQQKFLSLDKSFRKEKVTVLSLNGDFFVPLSKNKKRVLAYGFELTHNKVISNAYGKKLKVDNHKITGFSDNFTVQTRYPNGGSTYTSSALYLNYRQNINAKTTLNTGIRYVHTYLTAKWLNNTFITLPKNNISLNNSAVTATLGYAYLPHKNLQLNAVLSSGFRAPNIDDVGKVREKKGKVTVPNIYLKPEYAYNAEVGLIKYLNEKKIQFTATAYYTLLNNYITRDFYKLAQKKTILYDKEEAITVANVNKKTAYVFGGTATFKGYINENLSSEANLTYTKGKTYDTKVPLSSIPPAFGKIAFNYQKEDFKVTLNYVFNAKKRYKDYNLIEGIDNIEQTPFNLKEKKYVGTPAWGTLNLLANYRVNNTLTVYANISNILDVHYKEFASGVSASGRNFSLAFLLNI